jgi:hypothetical protein
MEARISEIEAELQRSRGPCWKEGVLWKKGMGAVYRPWKQRMCRIDVDSTFGYYDGDTLKGVIALADSEIKLLAPEDADQRPFAFVIIGGTVLEGGSTVFRSDGLVLAADSELEMVQWCAYLRIASTGLSRGTAPLQDLSAPATRPALEPIPNEALMGRPTGTPRADTDLSIQVFLDGGNNNCVILICD